MSSERDVIGSWSEVKLDILREYAAPYSRIMWKRGFYHLYIDAFAAGGSHVSRTTGEIVAGNVGIALSTQPPFREYHLIDAKTARVNELRQIAGDRRDVHIHLGDCNTILVRDVFPKHAIRINGGPYAYSIRTTSIFPGISLPQQAE